MADQTQTTPEATTPTPAPVADSPEPDIDSLLAHIPDLKEIFGDEPGERAPKQKKEPASEAAEVPAIEDEIPPGLDPALPLVEEPEPTEEEPEEEEPEEVKPDSVQKRIDKITAARRAAEEEAAALKTELADLKSKQLPPVAPTPQSPLADINSQDELVRRVQLAREAKTWAIQHLDGGEVALPNGETKFFNGDQVKVLLSRAEDMLSVHIPQRHQFLNEKQQWESTSKKSYPNLYKPGHKDQQELQSWKKVFPECQRFPDVDLIVGDAILGRTIRLQREAAKKAGVQANGTNLPLSAPAPAAAPRVPRNRVLSGAELTAIATDPQGGAFDKFVNQLIADAEQNRPAQRAKR